jgi:NaMN:DMB phosphoribosyltransferase
MHIEELIQKVVPTNKNIIQSAQTHFDNLIKPVGSLAQLETMTSRYAAMRGSVEKEELLDPAPGVLLLFGNEKSSEDLALALGGNLPVVVVARQLDVVTCPVFITTEATDDLIEEGAMLTTEYLGEEKGKVLLLGSLNKEAPLNNWQEHLTEVDPYFFLEEVQDKLVSAMAGAILEAAGQRLPIILDGVDACLGAIAAAKFNPAVLDYCYVGHVTLEKGMPKVLEFLHMQAPLCLDIPTGDGVGAVACLSLLKAGIKAYKEMETFKEAGVAMEELAYAQHKA